MSKKKKKGQIGQVCLTLDNWGQFLATPMNTFRAYSSSHIRLWAKRMELDVPKNAIKIWATLYNTPEANRVQVRVQIQYDEYPSIFHKKTELFTDESCDARLKKWVDKPVYLEVEYLEG